jgi:hypothetical protein
MVDSYMVTVFLRQVLYFDHSDFPFPFFAPSSGVSRTLILQTGHFVLLPFENAASAAFQTFTHGKSTVLP